MKKIQSGAILTLAALIMAISAQGADDAKDSDVLVTAARDQRSISTVAANVQVVTAEDIAKSGYNNVVEALTHEAGIQFRSSSGNASQSEIAMRGFGENSHGRVLVLLDGQKLNRPDLAGINWLQIPVANVERIEVVHGANSALYGDHAVAGVINVITRKGGEDAECVLSVSGGSFESDMESARISGAAGAMTYSVTAQHEGTEGYRDRSGYDTFGVAASLGYDIADAVNAALSISYDELSYELPGWLTQVQMDEDPTQAGNPDDSADDEYLNVNAVLNADITENSRVRTELAFSRKDIKSDMASWFSYSDSVIDTYGFRPEFIADAKVLDRKNHVIVGLDYYMDTMTVDRYGDLARTMPSIYADVDKSTLGVYVSDQVTLTDNLLLDLAIRWEQAEISANVKDTSDVLVDDEKDHEETVYNASLIYLCDSGSRLFVRAGSVYRYPFVDEQVSYYGFGSDQLYSDIEAETGDNYEIGATIAACENVVLNLTAFLLEMDDEISYNSVTFRNENLDSTRHAGLETSVAWAPCDAASIDLSYTYTEAKFTDGPNDGMMIPLVPEHTATLGLKMALPCDISVAPRVRYVSHRYLGGDYANTAPQLDNFVVADLAVSYAPQAIEGLELFAAVNNIFDEEYVEVGYQGFSDIGYYPAAERSVRAGATYRF